MIPVRFLVPFFRPADRRHDQRLYGVEKEA